MHCLCCRDWGARQRSARRPDVAARVVAGSTRRKAIDAGVPGSAKTNAERRRAPVRLVGGDSAVEESRIVAVSTLAGAGAGSDTAEGVPAGPDLVDSEGGRGVSQAIGEF